MAHPEGLNIMVEESIQGAEVDMIAPGDLAVPQGNSLLDRAKRVVRPITATGLALGGLLFSGGPEEVAAREPIAETAGPAEANPDGIDYAFRAYLPLALTRQKPPVQTPIVEPTDEPIPTIRPNNPSATPTRTPSSEPSPTTAPTATATETQPPTPTTTETPETGPLRELAISKGDTIIIANKPSIELAMVGRNGDENSGAAVVGYNFSEMTDPVLDKDYVVGTVVRNGRPMTIRMLVRQVEPGLLPRIKQSDPLVDTRLGSEVILHAGKDEKEKTLVITDAGGASLGPAFTGDYKTGADFHINASASGNAKTAILDFQDYSEADHTSRVLQLSFDLQKRKWTILNGVKDIGTGRFTSPLQRLYDFSPAHSDMRFQITDNTLIIPASEFQEEMRINIPHMLKGETTAIASSKTGSKNTQAAIKVKQASIRFFEISDGDLVESPETSLPTLSETAASVGKRIMVRVDGYGTAPGDRALHERTAEIFDPTSFWRDNTDIQDDYLDKDQLTARMLSIGMPESELIQSIKDHPLSTFHYGPRGTDNGPIGTLFNPDGTLINRILLLKMIEAAQANGSVIFLNTDVPPDLTLARVAGAKETTRLSAMLRAIEDLRALKPGNSIVFMMAGDSEFINTDGLTEKQAIEALHYALETTQKAGIRTGLGNIIGPGDNAIDSDMGDGKSSKFYSMIGQSTVGLRDITLGFNYNLTPRNWNNGSRMSLFIRSKMPREEQSMIYSSGALNLAEIFRQEAISQ